MGMVARLPVPEVVRAIDPMPDPDYTDAYVVDVSGAERRSPQRWARATFEDSPVAMRRFLLAGWAVLGLRLGPRSSPDHVLGWRIRDSSPESVLLELRSRSITAHLVFWLDGSRLVLSSAIRYDRRFGALVWPVASLIHRRAVPYLLHHAAATTSPASGGS